MPIYRTTLTANNLDLASLGVAVSDVADWFSAGPRTLARSRIPGRLGSLISRVDYGEKLVTVTGTVIADSLSARATLVDRLLQQLAGAPIALTRVDASGRTTGLGYVDGKIEVTPVKPGMSSRAAGIRFGVVLPGGIITESAPLPYGFGTTRSAMPLGTAPIAPLIRLMGTATNPILTYRNLAGDVIGAVTFTVTLGVNDWLEIDCSSSRIEKVVGGTRSDAYSAYAGQATNLPTLDPADGDYANAGWPTLEVSAGTGIALYAKRYW